MGKCQIELGLFLQIKLLLKLHVHKILQNREKKFILQVHVVQDKNCETAHTP